MVAALIAAALGGCNRSLPSEWERKNETLVDKQEEDPVPPAPVFPARAALLEFEVRGQRDFRYYIDGASLSVDPKGIIRYTLVARSPSGIDNVTYEALRCKTDEYRVYALGRADGTWGGRPGNWRSIAESRQPQHRALQREYFCPQNNPIHNADEGRSALQQNGHAWSRGFSGDRALGR